MRRFLVIASVVSFCTVGPALAADKKAPAKGGAAGGVKIDFSKQIEPILKETCYDCHGTKKQKGGLRLDSPDAIMKGGENGEVVIPGKAADSTMYKSIILPPDSDEIMPPKGDPLKKSQTDLIKDWINQGANFGGATGKKADASEGAKPSQAAQVPAADPKALDKLRALGALAMPLARDTNLLTIDFRAEADKIADAQLAELKSVAQQIAWLNLAKSKVTDAGLASVGALPNLSRLHLENTAITDAGVAHLKGAKLEYLNLYGTQITDASAAHLKQIKTLQKLFVWQTKMTAAAAKDLETAIPGLKVDTGWDPASMPKPAPVAEAKKADDKKADAKTDAKKPADKKKNKKK